MSTGAVTFSAYRAHRRDDPVPVAGPFDTFDAAADAAAEVDARAAAIGDVLHLFAAVTA